MLQLIRNRAGLVLAGLIAALCPLLMAPTGGFPSRPQFQSEAIGSRSATATVGQTIAAVSGTNFNPYVFCADGQASGSRCWAFRIGGAADLQISAADDTGTPVSAALDCTRSGTTATGCTITASSPITCTTACNVSGITVGQSAHIMKPAATNRASTTTGTLDPDLQFTNLPDGKYEAEFVYQVAAGAGGFTARTDTTACNGVAVTQVGVQNGQGTATPNATNYGNLESNAGAGTFNVEGQGSIISAASSLSPYGLCWAQNSSNVANTTLSAGSWLRLTRLQ